LPTVAQSAKVGFPRVPRAVVLFYRSAPSDNGPASLGARNFWIVKSLCIRRLEGCEKTNADCSNSVAPVICRNSSTAPRSIAIQDKPRFPLNLLARRRLLESGLKRKV